jgi:hypothetical protein
MEERGNTLEEEFFRKQNAELLEKMRGERERAEARMIMSDASGIADMAVIDRLLDSGVTPASMMALELAPLAAVAWADHKIEDKERKAILQDAEASGVVTGSEAYAMLEGWLTQAPPASLMDTWAEYARNVAASLDDTQRREMRDHIVTRAKAVANAAGGFAGLGSKMSAAEEAVVKRVESAFGA